MIVLLGLLGAISNRIRGMDVEIYLFKKLRLNEDHINSIIFAVTFSAISSVWWHAPVLFLGMLGGSATGWSEFVSGCKGIYKLNEKISDYSWISRIIKIKSQFTCFGWGCIRGLIWTLCLYTAFFICGFNAWLIILVAYLFYPSYRIGYFIDKDGDIFENSEPIFGFLLWAVCYASI